MIFFKKSKLARIAQLETEIKYAEKAKLFGQGMTSSGYSTFVEKAGELARLKTLLGIKE
jgi:hypothetical protein